MTERRERERDDRLPAAERGTAAAGPIGGIVRAAIGGVAGATIEGEDDEMAEAHASANADGSADPGRWR